MIDIRVCSVLRILAARRRDFPLHGDSLDAVAREAISEAIPPGLLLPGPDRGEQQQDTARACFERVYADLCAGKRG